MNEVTFNPRATKIIRYYLIVYLIVMPVACGLMILIFTRLSISTTHSWKDTLLLWLALTSSGILGGFLGLFLVRKKYLEVLSITVSDRKIVGPRGWRRKSFEIGRLDRARSCHRNLYQRLTRMRSLWFRDGDELEICDAFYGKEQIETLLEMLQLKN